MSVVAMGRGERVYLPGMIFSQMNFLVVGSPFTFLWVLKLTKE